MTMKNGNSMQIGVIGVGHLGNFHLKKLSEIPGISISGFYDIDQKHAEEMSRIHNISSFSSLESLLSASDAVSVVTPTSSHYKITEKALDANCHVFIEKPITENIEQAMLRADINRENKGAEVTLSLLEMINLIPKILN